MVRIVPADKWFITVNRGNKNLDKGFLTHKMGNIHVPCGDFTPKDNMKTKIVLVIHAQYKKMLAKMIDTLSF